MRRLREFLLLCVAAVLVAPRAAGGDEPKTEMVPDSLQGKWGLVSTEEGGEAKRYLNRSLVFENNEYRFYVKDLLVRRAVVTIDPCVKPLAMDLLQQIGPTEGQVGKCIYEIKADVLTIAQGLYRKERPSQFDSETAACSSVTVWRREKQ